MKTINLLLIAAILGASTMTACKEAPPPPPPTPVVELPPPPPPQPVAPDDITQLALINAVINQDIKYISEQLARPIIVDTPLKIRTMENALAFRESLKKYQFLYDNIRRDTDDLTLLFLIVATDKKPLFDLVIAKNPDINIPSFGNITPYHMATMNSNSAMIKILLEKGATPNLVGDDNDIVKAIRRKDYESAKIVFNYAKKNGVNMVPFLPTITDSVNLGDLKLMTFLIDEIGLDPNQPDMKTGKYPMEGAILGKNEETVKMLLAAGAKLDILDSRGRSPISMLIYDDKNATSEGAIKTLLTFSKFLINNGVPVNAANAKGETVVFDAVKAGNIELINMLMENGANINIRNNAGETVLFIPVETANIPVANALLKQGINKNIKNRKGFDAATTAAQSGYMDIFDAINNYRPQ